MLSFADWYVSAPVNKLVTSLFEYLIPSPPTSDGEGSGGSSVGGTVSKRVCMGATVEIHEDMMFDHMLRRQQQLNWRGSPQARVSF